MLARRLLLIDMTPIGGPAATGAVKDVYFGDWPADRLLHVMGGDAGMLRIAAGKGAPRWLVQTEGLAQQLAAAFRPDLILYRPVADQPDLHRFAVEAAAGTNAPLATWTMDDWIGRLAASDGPAAAEAFAASLAPMFARAAVNFVISEGMAKAYGARFGQAFEVLRNAVDPSPAASDPAGSPGGAFRIRYAGSLAPETTLASVERVAAAVSAMARTSERISLEIRTQPHWRAMHGRRFRGLAGVSIGAADMDEAGYRAWIADADLLLVAYNFDEVTTSYLRYSFANKIPEALASGSAILLHGPASLETVRYLTDRQLAIAVTTPDTELLKTEIASAVGAPDRRRDLAMRARAHAAAAFERSERRAAFIATVRRVAARLPVDAEAAAGEQVQFDECAFVYAAIDAGARPGVMIDVGAHHGGSLKRFAAAGWTVHAFEPDPANREALLRATQGGPGRVSVSASAVAAEEAASAPFFRSDVSTGISSLGRFHESHAAAGDVPVTTLNRLIEDEKLDAIDFLKIDVEGFEWDVLQGLDFDRVRPRAILAEFEDRKTANRGVTAARLAGFLIDHGYEVWASEWWPVVEYGRTHSWRRLRRWPCETAPDGWGNLLAFIKPPCPDAIEDGFSLAVAGGSFGLSAERAVARFGAPPRPRSPLRRAIDALATRFPGAYRAARAVAGPVLRATGRRS
ncbi:MAG: FkbM family methyltransferase [Alphaproteobacteria bacterium]|nr:FkbM family methyltransferase [Alphaproteobacteria bacterium]